MVRTIIANRNVEKYLEKCAQDNKFSFGLVIGQPTQQNKDYIVHLAKNIEVSEHEAEGESGREVPKVRKTEDIDVHALANHVISVIKMIPGCFYVLGIFIVDEKNIFDDESATKKGKQLLLETNNVLKQNKYFRGNSDALVNNEKLLISYSSLSKSVVCKSFESKGESGFFMPVDWKFLDKPTEWTLFETNYELDDVFPIIEKNKKINIENHFGITLETITNYIDNSEIFIQNEPVEETQVLENYIKKYQNKQDPIRSLKASLFLPATASSAEPIVIEKFEGLIRFSGVIASRIWTHQKNSFKEIHNFIRNDILRSLASRIQIYCDGLIDPNAPEDTVIVNEPPRRVYFDLPQCYGIQFCEYIFRGEAPSVAAAQAKDILDLVIEPNTINADFEGLPEDDSLSLHNLPLPVLNPTGLRIREYGRWMYMAGLATAIFLLIVSILLHFILR